MNFNKILAVGLLSSFISAPLFAADLTIHNDTDAWSTSVTNKGSCSTILDKMGYKGETAPRTTNKIPAAAIFVACNIHIHDCAADVYMTNNCTGPIIATAVFDTSKGIQSITAKDNSKYILTASKNSFEITLSEKKAS